MTTIILTIIGILLAALAVMGVMYWGGSSFTGSDSKAAATTLVSHTVQIETAMRGYRLQYGKYPGDELGNGALQELVDKDYLDRIPTSPVKTSYSTDWKMDYQRGIVRSTIGDASDDKAEEVCGVLRTRMGFSGSPKQCDDPSLDNKDPCCSMSAAEL